MLPSEPITIPLPSRSSTPRPTEFRQRSDTLSSDSSVSTELQTPDTPPAIGVLDSFDTAYSPPDVPCNDERKGYTRGKLSRSRTSYREKKAKIKSIVTLNRSFSSLNIIPTQTYEPGHSEPLPNHFEAIPRELQLDILSWVAIGYEGKGRWEGPVGGKKELIRLSGVSRSWRDLCLDGQLWADIDLTLMAPFLPAATLERVLESSKLYARALVLRGMNDITSIPVLSNLTKLDLRGCRALTADAICAVIRGAPDLVDVNLKGVQAVRPEVLHAMSGNRLKVLNVTRCRRISLEDMADFLQKTKADIEVLRVAGLVGSAKSFVDHAKVEVLDMLGCEVDDEDLAGLSERITHLILSSTNVSIGMFRNLKLPNLEKLEVAHTRLFRSSNDPSLLVKFLRTTPHLQRLDLDSVTSRMGINDQVLHTLVDFCPDLQELHISNARGVSEDAMIRLIRGCPLTHLEADNTAAGNAVMREFVKRRTGSIQILDCRGITPAGYNALASTTQPRQGWEGYAARPFQYDNTGGTVLKTFWSWKRVGVPLSWRAARDQYYTLESKASRPEAARRGSWFRDDEFDDRGCTIM